MILTLQHCIEYDSLENCASEEETFDFWKKPKKIVFSTTQMNLDMANQDEPLEKISNFAMEQVTLGNSYQLEA